MTKLEAGSRLATLSSAAKDLALKPQCVYWNEEAAIELIKAGLAVPTRIEDTEDVKAIREALGYDRDGAGVPEDE